MISQVGKQVGGVSITTPSYDYMGPHKQANYPQIYCANTAKALRHPVVTEATGRQVEREVELSDVIICHCWPFSEYFTGSERRLLYKHNDNA